MIQVLTESALPFSLDEFRDHVRVSDRDHDPALRRALYAAAVDVETKAGIRLRSSSLYDYFRGIPEPFRFSAGPVNSITVVRNMTDAADVAATAYELDLVGGWPTLRSLSNSAWSSSKTYRVTYAAGYASIPSPLQVAVFELAAMHFENREAATPVQMHALPFSINSILQGYGPRGV